MTGRRVVIGLGNAFRRDDGAGPAVVRALAGRVTGDVVLVELDGEPARVVDAWTGADLAVVVDAVRSGAPAGTVHRLGPGRHLPPGGWGPGGSHTLGVAEAVALAAAVGRRPRRLVCFGIEGSDFADGPGLSPPVRQAVETVAGRVALELANRGG